MVQEVYRPQHTKEFGVDNQIQEILLEKNDSLLLKINNNRTILVLIVEGRVTQREVRVSRAVAPRRTWVRIRLAIHSADRPRRVVSRPRATE